MLRTLSVAFLLAAAAGSASAQTGPGRIAVGAQVGTTGLGAEVQVQASEFLNVRAGGDFFNYEEDFETGDFDYAGEADFSTVSAFVDLHPFNNGFFVSGGGFLGDRTVTVAGTPNRDVVIAGQIFPPPRFGRLVGEADFGGAAPFLGLGYNNTFRTAGRIGFKALVGAAFGEDPTVELRREGGDPLPAAIQAQFDADREAEERDLEQELEDFKTLPVLQLGLTYRF